ncbi:integrase catalytic domain-containing protein [Trichonephila inaurata madagascariensis]|uniref:Integrase catalytic domain-containing protein n=1 Tax=Trichonephila inaurata madagascariensis TaxID=2747483 RepID=A0A8X6XYY2_9ARAC|nr:integrase catalytic domain-containing protein [Trichonephila inaurata madagascariensis]
MRSFITKKLSNCLGLPAIKKEKLSVYTFGNKTPIEKDYDVVNLTLKNKDSPNLKIDIETLVTDQISAANISPPELVNILQAVQLENLVLADSPVCQEPITILIEADYYYNVVTGKIKHLNKKLVAVETIFGWCLQGRNSENQSSLALSVIVQENLILDQLKKFWGLEVSGLIDSKNESDVSENQIMKNFESNIKYNEKAKQYKNYLKQGIIELVPDSDSDSNNVTFYLPHREVIRKDSPSSQLRIVYDASSHDANSPSLNSCLHIGPNLYPEVFDILLRLRLNVVAFTADMKQAFLQIMLNEEDRDVTKFLFLNDPFDESELPSVYQFTRVLFGISSSPFLLSATIKHHLKKYLEKYTDTVNFLNENIYVDNIIGSQLIVNQALTITLEATKIFEDASISLHKWQTNSKSLHKAWQDKGVISDENPHFETFEKDNLPYKVLGIAWNSREDFLYFDIKGSIDFVSKRVDTKRFILQVLSRIFDPIGFLGPFTLRIKHLMQKVWLLGVEWDESLPEDIISLWTDWCEEVPQLTDFSIPRCYFSDPLMNNFKTLELHLFSDASTKAYETVSYIRVTSSIKEILTSFVASKNRIAPLKTLTFQRLELMGALLSARLSSNILKALKLDIPCFFWTDSKITYFGVRGLPERFKPFIKNRIQEIQKLTSPSNCHHCPGIQNSADIVSREVKISRLLNDTSWLQGPEWLRLPPEFWPESKNEDSSIIHLI